HPRGVEARFERGSWEVPNVFRVLQREGGVEEGEMYRAFNMGIGMVAVVPCDRADAVVEELRGAGEDAWVAGEIVPGDRRVILS
ncbi:MAG TPA: AIR synthase-related protein, partial [Longimicrobiaceae bacterium]|nr:AIR synthase-related protein [Longimicrobiaceae bacterium]